MNHDLYRQKLNALNANLRCHQFAFQTHQIAHSNGLPVGLIGCQLQSLIEQHDTVAFNLLDYPLNHQTCCW
jgi:hypothetical protein